MLERLKKADAQGLAVAALFFIAIVWGGTFVVVADAIAVYPIYAFLTWRFAIAAIAFLLIFPKVIFKLDRHNLAMGIPAGVLLSVGYIFQTLGLLPADQGGTTAARTAFLTGMYVVIVPLVQALIKRKMPNKGTSIGMVLALAGLWFLSGLSLTGQSGWVVGDTYVLLSAFAYSAHMILLGRNDKEHDSLALTFIQLSVVAIISGVMSVATGEHAGFPTGFNVWFAILLCGLVASALAFAIQTWSQRILPPSRVALILISEPALGGVFGWVVAGHAPGREVFGAILMLSGMLTSELIAARVAESSDQRLKRSIEGVPVYADDPHKKRSIEVHTDAAGTTEIYTESDPPQS